VKYLLDTNTVIALLNDRPAAVRSRFRDVQRGGAWVGISSVVLFELWFGVARSQRQAENADRIRAFLAGPIDVVPLDSADARLAGELRATLQAAGTPIGPYDLQIAGQALRTEAILATSNISEFRRVPALVCEDWSRPAA
jgi:tRNA(fMet)-specific endonuclease VapC